MARVQKPSVCRLQTSATPTFVAGAELCMGVRYEPALLEFHHSEQAEQAEAGSARIK